jgi:hypothetical protein
MKKLVRKLLAEPLSREFDLDDPALTTARKVVLRKKHFLRAIYTEWYRLIAKQIPDGPGKVVELGSGSGFLQETIRGLVTSEVFWLPDLSLVMDAQRLPFSGPIGESNRDDGRAPSYPARALFLRPSSALPDTGWRRGNDRTLG